MSDPKYAVKLSVVLPIFNEIGSLSELDRQLSEAVTSLGFPCEVVCVDDGSTDGSWARLQELSSSNPMYRMVKLRRNYGQSAALAAGVDVARGEFIVLMDADLQNDPADIPRLINEVHKGFDLVSGWRRSRQDFFWSRRLPSIIANSLIAKVTDVDLHDIGCTLKIYRSEYIKDITIYGEMHRFLPALVRQAGGKIGEIEVNHHARKYGKSKYGIERTAKVVLDLMTVQFLGFFGSKPIYIFGGAGLACMVVSVLTLIYIVIDKILFGKSLIESPLLLLSVMFTLVGIQFLVIGLLAELIVRVWHESQGKLPYKIIRIVSSGQSEL